MRPGSKVEIRLRYIGIFHTQYVCAFQLTDWLDSINLQPPDKLIIGFKHHSSTDYDTGN